MRALLCSGLLIGCLVVPAASGVEPPGFEAWSHTREFSRSGPARSDYVLGLGALQKIGGRWRHKRSESLSGELERITWHVNEGYTAAAAYQWFVAQMPNHAAKLLFECSGRSCGSSAQWADRVFSQRVLFGHDERQHYSVWRLRQGEELWSVVLYAVDRAHRHHYLHMDLLRHL